MATLSKTIVFSKESLSNAILSDNILTTCKTTSKVSFNLPYDSTVTSAMFTLVVDNTSGEGESRLKECHIIADDGLGFTQLILGHDEQYQTKDDDPYSNESYHGTNSSREIRFENYSLAVLDSQSLWYNNVYFSFQIRLDHDSDVASYVTIKELRLTITYNVEPEWQWNSKSVQIQTDGLQVKIFWEQATIQYGNSDKVRYSLSAIYDGTTTKLGDTDKCELVFTPPVYNKPVEYYLIVYSSDKEIAHIEHYVGEFTATLEEPSHYIIRCYVNDGWQDCIVKYYNGENWLECIVKYYDGTRWVECSF